MKGSYVLRIDTKSENYQILNKLFGVQKAQNPKGYWELVIDDKNKFFNNAINIIVDSIEKNKLELNELGIGSNYMSIWYFYEFKGQCNMEFSPLQLKKMGDSMLTFCISCWEEE